MYKYTVNLIKLYFIVPIILSIRNTKQRTNE